MTLKKVVRRFSVFNENRFTPKEENELAKKIYEIVNPFGINTKDVLRGMVTYLKSNKLIHNRTVHFDDYVEALFGFIKRKYGKSQIQCLDLDNWDYFESAIDNDFPYVIEHF